MKIWLPYIRTGSGTDIYTERLARALEACGHQTVLHPFAHGWQYAPWRLRATPPPPGVAIIVANTWNGFAFSRPGSKLVVVEHLCIHDPCYLPYRGRLQGVFHDQLVRRFERASVRAADAVVAVSAYTAERLYEAFGGPRAEVIYNGIDLDCFFPDPEKTPLAGERTVRLLFVGNLTWRKGADLLPEIIRKLGPGYELYYTSGLRTRDRYDHVPGMRPVGRLSQCQLVSAYRKADVVVLPSRLEGFGYVAAEAMACGTPVVATRISSLPELIEDGITGRLCPLDDTDAFVAAIREMTARTRTRMDMARRARCRAVACFGLQRMAHAYLALFEGL